MRDKLMERRRRLCLRLAVLPGDRTPERCAVAQGIANIDARIGLNQGRE